MKGGVMQQDKQNEARLTPDLKPRPAMREPRQHQQPRISSQPRDARGLLSDVY